MKKHTFTSVIGFAIFIGLFGQSLHLQAASITHGPMLGRGTENSMGVWMRTSEPAEISVRYGIAEDQLGSLSQSSRTKLSRDNTGWVALENLEPGQRYFCELLVDGQSTGRTASFKTLQAAEATEWNPKGLFNFKFEFACGNDQGPLPADRVFMPTYATMNRLIRDDIDFAILNGDFIYETDRDWTVARWMQENQVEKVPINVGLTPDIVGVWQNYKTYLDRSEELREWHANMPSYYTIDDHEILNDTYGCGEIGRIDREAVFRDPATQAWLDYVGWSNHMVDFQKIRLGQASMSKDSSVLRDPSADFSNLDLGKAATLHVHWGEGAGIPIFPRRALAEDVPMDDPNAGVYEVLEIINEHEVKVRPAFRADSESVYSIGTGLYSRMRISNCDIFMLDTRTFRQMHDVTDPARKGLSMIGRRQKKWLMAEMSKSDADFFFVVSSVNFMIPHSGSMHRGGGVPNKDDAWTVFLDEREALIRFWEGLDRPVFILTGDLHDSLAIRITDRIWEFASAPLNSKNHYLGAEGNRPVNGRFQYGPRPCEIRWSTAMLDDTKREDRLQKVYCVVQINNVFSNPGGPTGRRWVAYDIPHVIFQYYDGVSGKLLYAESVLARQVAM